MSFNILLSLFLSSFLGRGHSYILSESCPDVEIIKPCTCTVSDFINIDCSAVESESQLQEILSQNVTAGNFARLIIKDNHAIKTLYHGIFGNNQFVEFIIDDTSIFSVQSGVFDASLDTTIKLTIASSNINDFPFGEIEKYGKLETLDLSSNTILDIIAINSSTLKHFNIENNLLSYIPEPYYFHLPALQTFLGGYNYIADVMTGTFSSMESLQLVDLQVNYIPYIGTNTFVFHGDNTSLYIGNNLSPSVHSQSFQGVTNILSFDYNDLTQLVEEIWKPTLENFALLSLEGNPFICGCDMAWLIRNDTLLAQVMTSAACKDGTPIHDLDPADFLDCP